jgi:hypothetical protein
MRQNGRTKKNSPLSSSACQYIPYDITIESRNLFPVPGTAMLPAQNFSIHLPRNEPGIRHLRSMPASTVITAITRNATPAYQRLNVRK